MITLFSRSRVIAILSPLLLLSAVRSSYGQVSPLDAMAASMTGQQLINGLRDAANNIVSHAGDVARQTATSIANDLNGQADQLNIILGTQVNRPLSELRQSFETEIERSLVQLSLAQTAVDRLRRCVREDVLTTISALQSALGQTTASVLPWARGNPQVLSSVVLNDPNGYGLRVQVPASLRLTGIQLTSNCRHPSARSVGPDDQSRPATVSIESNTRSVVAIPALPRAGVYRLVLTYPRKQYLMFCNDYATEYSIPVLPPAQFTVEYTVTSRVRYPLTREFHIAHFNEGSDDHNDRHPNAVYNPPSGWTYNSHRMDIHSSPGAVLEHEDKSGNGIFMQWRIPAKGGCVTMFGIGSCTGPGKWVDLDFYITATKDTIVDGPTVLKTDARAFGYGQALTIPVAPPLAPDQSFASRSVSVSVRFPDGALHAIEPRSGDRPLTASELGGAKYSWDPASQTLTVTAPLAACSS
jgi:hypothetical protein